MAYQTGTATDPTDLLDKLRLFALANGFTVNFWGDRTAGTAPRKSLHLTKGGMSGAFQTDSAVGTATNPGSYIGTYGHDAYAGGGGTEAQANRSLSCWSNDLTGPYQAYHFFCDNAGAQPYLYVVVETAAGTFKHFGIGRVIPFGAVTTGVFVHASVWNMSTIHVNSPFDTRHSWPFDSTENTSRVAPGNQIRADSDTIVPRWYDPATGHLMWGGVRPSNGWVRSPMAVGASERTGRTILTPCLMAGIRTGGNYSPIGQAPNVRWARLKYVDPGQTLTIGTDVWKVFPVIRKNGATGQPNSSDYGYAYLVN